MEADVMKATSTSEDGYDWTAFAEEVGIQLAHPPGVAGSYGNLEVLSAEWLAPEGDMPAMVELRVKTLEGRVLHFDMVLEHTAILDASDDYDLIDGDLTKHEYDFSKPEEIARYFGS